MSNSNHSICPVCASDYWELIYAGQVRDGNYGQTIDSKVYKCKSCNIGKLDELDTLDIDDYISTNYREKLNQDHDFKKYAEIHDPLLKFVFQSIWPDNLRCNKLADIGCCAGILLDHLSGLSNELIAVEPNEQFSKGLQSKYAYYKDITDCLKVHKNEVDFCFSNQVIEHVENPLLFLRNIFNLTKSNGRILISTPNHNDIAMGLIPEFFAPFFYRTQHRWYFDSSSLEKLARKAGFVDIKIKHIHMFGISNIFHWMKDKSPKGNLKFNNSCDDHIDNLWKAWVEQNKLSDNLFLYARKP